MRFIIPITPLSNSNGYNSHHQMREVFVRPYDFRAIDCSICSLLQDVFSVLCPLITPAMQSNGNSHGRPQVKIYFFPTSLAWGRLWGPRSLTFKKLLI